MQEVFEKVFKELDKYKKKHKGSSGYYVSVTNDIKAIVKQVAEEYNNGWISVSEGLPEEYKLYDITFKNSAGTHSDSAIFNTYLKKWFWDADETELVENEILAWAEKREPYQPRRVNRNE